MKKMYKVDVQTKKGGMTNFFDSKEMAQDYAIVVSTFQGFRYRITEVYVNEEVEA